MTDVVQHFKFSILSWPHATTGYALSVQPAPFFDLPMTGKRMKVLLLIGSIVTHYLVNRYTY